MLSVTDWANGIFFALSRSAIFAGFRAFQLRLPPHIRKLSFSLTFGNRRPCYFALVGLAVQLWAGPVPLSPAAGRCVPVVVGGFSVFFAKRTLMISAFDCALR